ncbi:MAG: sterol carrier family protein [Streptosporangiaceae bacterium]
MNPRIEPSAEALQLVRQAYAAGDSPARPLEKAAVKHLLNRLMAVAPGKSVEVRIPPYSAVQCVAGTRHTRGTPPNVVETDARTWIDLATGALTWSEAVTTGRVRATGTRSDLTEVLRLLH